MHNGPNVQVYSVTDPDGAGGAAPAWAPTFQVSGCFCSIACAAAYNFSSKDLNETICRRFTLLKNMARALGCHGDVVPAPPRTALSMFGGYMSIEEFREASQQGPSGEKPRRFFTATTPMRCARQQVEEVHADDVSEGFSFVPVDEKRANRGILSSLQNKSRKMVELRSALHSSMDLSITTCGGDDSGGAPGKGSPSPLCAGAQ